MTLGERIKHYRGSKDLSLNRLAILADVSPAYISALENNKSDSPSVEIAQKIAKALNISVLDLISDTKSEQVCQLFIGISLKVPNHTFSLFCQIHENDRNPRIH